GMVQVLLEDRFRVRVHRETRELPLYILSIAKGGPKLQQYNADGCVDRGAGTPATAPTDQQGRVFCGSSIVSNGQWNASKMDMPGIVRILSSMLPRKVVDRTGLTGFFDVHLDLPPNPLDTT